MRETLPDIVAKPVNPAAMYLASLAPSGRKSMASQLRSVAKVITGSTELQWVNWQWVDRATLLSLIEVMRLAGKSPATINHAISAVKRVNEEAYHLGMVTIEQLHAVQSTPRFKGYRLISEEYPRRQEVRTAVKAALAGTQLMGLRDAALIATLAGAGLRKSEARHACTGDYREGSLRVMGKGNREALQPVSPDAREILDEYVPQLTNGPLFPAWNRYDQPSQRHLSMTGLDNIVSRHLPGVSPHKLRHAYASWLAEDGQPLAVIQRLMRHSNPNLTMRYIHNHKAQISAVENLRF